MHKIDLDREKLLCKVHELFRLENNADTRFFRGVDLTFFEICGIIRP